MATHREIMDEENNDMTMKVVMRAWFFMAGVAVASAGLAVHAHQDNVSAEDSQPKLVRSATQDGADGPSGRLFLRVPSANDAPEHTPPVENAEPPAEPSDQGDFQDEQGWDFFDETVSGNAVFIIDVSDSMDVTDVGGGEDYDGNSVGAMSRLVAVKTELIAYLRTIDSGVAFDIIWLAGGNAPKTQPPNTETLHGELVKCEDAVREQAIAQVKSQRMWHGTPTWEALRRACNDYPDDLGTLVLLTDGAPFPRHIAGDWGADQVPAILADFPGWFSGKRENGCKLIGIQVGNNAAAGDFLKKWCAQNDAKYVYR